MNKLLYRLPTKTVNRIERVLLIAETDYHIRYYGTKLGVLWAFINPFFQILVFYFAFTYLIGNGNDNKFILYLFSGIISWQFFTETTGSSIKLFMTKRFILENVKINKLDFFLSLIISKFRGYAVNLIIFIVFSYVFFVPNYTSNVFYIIPVLAGLIIFTLGVTFYLSTLFIFFRDLDHFWSLVLMAGFWTIPIVWDYNIIYNKFSFMLWNPLTVYIINIREILIYNTVPDIYNLSRSLVITLILAVSGYFFMRYRSKKALEFL